MVVKGSERAKRLVSIPLISVAMAMFRIDMMAIGNKDLPLCAYVGVKGLY